MGLSLRAYRMPVGNVDINVEKESLVRFWWNDEQLLQLLLDVGKQEHMELISFTKEQLLEVKRTIFHIIGGIFKEDKMYATKYSNESTIDFHARWSFNIDKINILLQELDWNKEHVVIYVSA